MAGAGIVAALALGGFAAGCEAGETAVSRGDRLWADSSYTEALAEYRLAVRQGGDEAALARVAHTYGRLGQLSEMQDAYDRLLPWAPEYTNQALFDYLDLAQRALRRGDRYGLAAAAEAALALDSGAPVAELASPLARYYAGNGDIERALAYFERALLTASGDSAADLLYEMGLVHEKQGNCGEAIGYFAVYGERAPRGRFAGDARWHTGNCAFELGRAARQAGELIDALSYIGLVLEYGVPENLQDQAWFERGEALLLLGRNDEALFAFQRVLQLNPARTGQLVQQAIRRIDQIRFGF